jgi:hypothetical protein
VPIAWCHGTVHYLTVRRFVRQQDDLNRVVRQLSANWPPLSMVS